jgi:uncharacterized protein
METQRQKDIIAFKSPSGRLVAYHANNLEVAEISNAAWNSWNKPQDQAFAEILDWESTVNLSTLSDSKLNYINSVNINVTQICNLKCIYCEAGGDGSYGRPEKKIAIDKAVPALQKIMDRIPNGGEFTVTFVGGEPLLYPDGIKILVDHCRNSLSPRDIRLQFRLITNGTLFTSDVLQIMSEHKINIVVSIDGPPELQDKIRPTAGGKGSSQKLIEGLKLLAANKDKLGLIIFRSIFGSHNVDVETVYDYFSQFEFSCYDFNFDVTCSAAGLSESFSNSLAKVAQKAFQEGGENALRKILYFDRIFDRLDRRVRVQNFCDSGKSFAVVDAQGSVFKCPWETNLKSHSVGQGNSFQIEALQDIEMSLIEHNNCGSCWARHLCGGGCMYAHGLATGQPSQPDPIYCQRTRSLISIAIPYYLESREVDYEETR